MTQDAGTLETLCAALERDWRERRDHTAADRLAAQYPDYAHHFYAFLSGLLAEELGATLPEDVMRESAQRTAALLERVGIPAIEARAPRRKKSRASDTRDGASPPAATSSGAGPGRATSRPPTDREHEVSLFSFLRQRTGLPPGEIADRLGASVQFLMGLGRVAQLPARAADAVVSRVAERFDIASRETLAVIGHRRASAAFASSKTPAAGGAIDYLTLVRTAKLSPADEAFWASLVDEPHDEQAGAA
jgi:hypothetical protein